jgi:hypothetical protein
MIIMHVISAVGGLVVVRCEGPVRKGFVYQSLEDLAAALRHVKVGDREAALAVGHASVARMAATRGWAEIPEWAIPAVGRIVMEVQAFGMPEEELPLGSIGFRCLPAACNQESGTLGYRSTDGRYAVVVYRQWIDPWRALHSLVGLKPSQYAAESDQLQSCGLPEAGKGAPWYLPNDLAEVVLKRHLALVTKPV